MSSFHCARRSFCDISKLVWHSRIWLSSSFCLSKNLFRLLLLETFSTKYVNSSLCTNAYNLHSAWIYSSCQINTYNPVRLYTCSFAAIDRFFLSPLASRVDMTWRFAVHSSTYLTTIVNDVSVRIYFHRVFFDDKYEIQSQSIAVSFYLHRVIKNTVCFYSHMTKFSQQFN